jgi:hypothetical protein
MEIKDHDRLITHEALKAARYRIDPLADEAAEAIIHSKDIKHLQEVVRHMATLDQGIPEELPQAVHDYFRISGEVNFSQEEKARLDRASDLFATYGPMVVMSLIFRSLPVTYMAQKPAHVLDLTKLLEEFAERRIIETAQFVFDAMEHKWYEADKRGIRTIQRVRLMHAAMRHLIRHKIKQDQEGMAYPWQESWGEPISQEDLLATLQTFSLEVIHGLERLGIKLTEQEENDWFFAWERVGLILGIEPDLLPRSRKQAEHIQNYIYQQLFVLPNPPGERLTSALTKTIVHLSPSKMLKKHVYVIMRFMIHNDNWYLNYMKLPGGSHHYFFIFLIRFMITTYGWMARVTGGQNSFVSKYAMKMLMGIYNAERGGKEAVFLVPRNLEELWKLERDLSRTH